MSSMSMAEADRRVAAGRDVVILTARAACPVPQETVRRVGVADPAPVSRPVPAAVSRPVPAAVSRRAPGPASRAIRGRATGVAGRGPTPLRLTRRGRFVLTVIIAAVAMIVSLLCASAADLAQASSHRAPARAGYRGMTRITVQPGQTLWSIASSARPSANTQTVVQRIIDANAMGGTLLKAGQLLWVPKR